jgi:hypothetical protein
MLLKDRRNQPSEQVLIDLGDGGQLSELGEGAGAVTVSSDDEEQPQRRAQGDD